MTCFKSACETIISSPSKHQIKVNKLSEVESKNWLKSDINQKLVGWSSGEIKFGLDQDSGKTNGLADKVIDAFMIGI